MMCLDWQAVVSIMGTEFTMIENSTNEALHTTRNSKGSRRARTLQAVYV